MIIIAIFKVQKKNSKATMHFSSYIIKIKSYIEKSLPQL